MDDAFDIRLAFNQIERSNRDVLTAFVFSWMLAVNLVQINDDAFRDCAPTPAEAKVHEHFLSNLIKVSEFIAPRIRALNPREQAKFVWVQDRLLELEQRRFTASGMIAKLTKYLAQNEELAQERKEIL